MASVGVPTNCGGMTLTTSGAVVATNNAITCTQLEANSLCSSTNFPGDNPIQRTAANGDMYLLVPAVVTNITINGIGYPITAGVIGPVPAADGKQFISTIQSRGRKNFQLLFA